MTGSRAGVVGTTEAAASAGPSCYELRLRGHLDGHWGAHLGGLLLAHDDDGSTTLRGTIPDQAGLFTLLQRVRDLGATLISLTAVPDPPTTSAAPPADPGRDAAVPPPRPGQSVAHPGPGVLMEHRAHFEDSTSLARSVVEELEGRLLGLCFHDLGLRRVTAQCFSANEASWRSMQRVGTRRGLHAVRESLHRTSEWLDVLGCALLDHEWRDRAGSG